MSRRNIAYIKPQEPSFIRKLKEQAGYKEGPTVETKREELGEVLQEDLLDQQDEQPTVVVLRSGDLTAEEAAKETLRLEKESEETPADLSTRIVFKAPEKTKSAEQTTKTPQKRPSASEDTRKLKKVKNKQLLSFNNDDDEEEEEE